MYKLSIPDENPSIHSNTQQGKVFQNNKIIYNSFMPF